MNDFLQSFEVKVNGQKIPVRIENDNQMRQQQFCEFFSTPFTLNLNECKVLTQESNQLVLNHCYDSQGVTKRISSPVFVIFANDNRIIDFISRKVPKRSKVHGLNEEERIKQFQRVVIKDNFNDSLKEFQRHYYVN